jgi:DNA-binding CsgD family transcriptional regulator
MICVQKKMKQITLSQLELTYNKIVQAPHLNELSALLNDIRDSYGLAYVVYRAIHLPYVPNPIVLPAFEPKYMPIYMNDDRLRIDPVATNDKDNFLPLDWTSIDNETSQAQPFFEEAEGHSVGRNGMSFPIRGPGGERAIFSIISNESPSEWRQMRLLYMREFHLIAHVFHNQVVRLSGPRFSTGKHQLSSRESETLQLAASGFVPKRIAAKLRVSPTAVRLYLQSARSKLDCTSLNQAIARAISLGLIEV